MANYNAYIELSPNYESVVDIDSEICGKSISFMKT